MEVTRILNIRTPRPSILAVIPARYQSQRFPGKPLCDIAGKPMIQWVYEAATECSGFSDVVVATDDDRIKDVVEAFSGKVLMTSPDHETGTDRVAEVAARVAGADVVVNVQGDQPFVTTEILDQLIEPFLTGNSVQMATVACPMPKAAFEDPNTVKVICDKNMDAIYFSRSAIPYFRNQNDAPVYHHVGLYAFDRRFLAEYSQLTQTPLETCEQLEQLRVLEHGHRIRVSLIPTAIPEVNTPEDLNVALEFVSRIGDKRS